MRDTSSQIHLRVRAVSGDKGKPSRTWRAAPPPVQLCGSTQQQDLWTRVEWLLQVQSEDKCRALPAQYITGKKHQPERQRGQVLLFKTVSFKGDEPE